MDIQRFWWYEIGPFRAKDERRKYPHPGEVVAYYRQQGNKTRKMLAQELQLSASEICRLENEGVGLDSVSCCRKLSSLLHIPASLFGLDTLAHPLHTPWWVDKGYAPFYAGEDGYPLTGQVIKHYREVRLQQSRHPQTLAPEAEKWTQRGLAEALGVSEFTVRKMENQHKGLDTITRREALSFILNVPPVLLGLDATAHDAFPFLEEQATRHLVKPRTLLLDTDILARYRQSQRDLWTAYFTDDAQNAFGKALRESKRLHEAIALTQGEQQRQLIEIQSLSHQFMAAVALERRDFPTVFAYADRAVLYARETKKTDLLASALLRRGMAHYGHGHFPVAVRDINEATSFVQSSSSHVRGTVLQNAGMIHAHVLQDQADVSAALRWLDHAESIARSGDFAEDPYFLKFNVGMYHIRRAIALIAIGRTTERRRRQSFQEALSELELAQQSTNPDMTRRCALINLFRAQAHCGLEEFCFAAKEALQALEVFKNIQSRINIGYIADLYEELRVSAYRNAPIVLRLGWELERLGAIPER
ncbi:MAG: hypothetical protein ABI413_15545 [Ktedonobacteraceae bacterium]